MHGDLVANGGLVAHFETVTKRNLPSIPELASILDPDPVVRDRSGALYRAIGPARGRDGSELPGSRGGGVEPPPG
jgi:hypothetical protein